MHSRIIRGATAAVLALALAACGNSDGGGGETTSSSSSSNASSTGTTSSNSDAKPTLTEKDGNPVLSFPDSDPPSELQVDVLEEGNGAEIGADDFITAEYVGQVWGKDTPFDSSFESGTPLQMSLSQLVPGWSKGLAGRHVGDKLILTLPPDDGYGSQGNAQAGIDGDDTISFYIEIQDSLSKNTAGQADAQVETDLSQLPVEITGDLGQPVTNVQIKDGSTEPTELQTTVIARGTGPEVGSSGVMFVAYYMTAFNGSTDVTWGDDGSGPQQVYLGSQSLLDELQGLPVGSRVLISFPSSNGGEGESSRPAGYAVVDILSYTAEDGAAAETD